MSLPPAALHSTTRHRRPDGRQDKEFSDTEGGLEFLAVVGIIRLQFSRGEASGTDGRARTDGPIIWRKLARNSNDTLAYL